jgi:alpha-beta hydrolase superfamily lysophospholipase
MELRRDHPESPPPVDPQDASIGEFRWRVSSTLIWVKIAALGAFALAAFVFADDTRTLVAIGAGAVIVLLYVLRDLLAPVRLEADADGLTVISGYFGHRRLAWAQIERIRVDQRNRMGLRSELLEIDAEDSLYLLSTYDLNAECDRVAAILRQLRDGETPSDPDPDADWEGD